MHRLKKYDPGIDKAIHFDIQNVADYYFSYNEEYWGIGSFNLAPPFSHFTTRYKFPRVLRSKKLGIRQMPKETYTNEILTIFKVLSEKEFKPFREKYFGFKTEADRPKLPKDSKWWVLISPFVVDKFWVSPHTFYIMALNDRGVLAEHGDNRPSMGHSKAFYVLGHKTFKESEANPNTVNSIFVYASCLALNFLNCKNVEIVKPIIPKKKKFKSTRRKPFQVHYHQLKVNVIGGSKQYEKSGNKTDIKQSLHIVRGHFRECGINGKGKLFGKYTGTYWIANHMRGDADIGVVQKDYKLE